MFYVCFLFQVLPALENQKAKLKDQLTKERQECLEMEMNVESMIIDVKEPPPIGNSKIVCGYCHHRGHRNTGSQPCKMKKCTEYTYCGLKDKHPEYFSKFNSLKVELRKKKAALKEIEGQIKSMDDFTTGSEFTFVKNLTPRMYAADSSYRVNKSKLMRDVRLLRTHLDGKIPAITANDGEQIRILISKCKKNVGIAPDSNFDTVGTSTANVLDASPIKNEVKEQRITELTDNQNSPKPKHKKHKKIKKVKKRKRERSSSSSEDEMPRQRYHHNVDATTYPYFNPNFPMAVPHPYSYSNPYFYPQPYNPQFGLCPAPYSTSYTTENRANINPPIYTRETF